MLNQRSYGTKYDGNLSTKDIASKFRAEIKTATGKELPAGLKVSVRYASFAGGSAIRVRITALPAGFPILNPESVRLSLTDPHTYHSGTERYSPEARALLAKLDAMVGAYNHDGSDIMTDHFDVKFYDGRAGFDWELEAADKLRIVGEIKGEAESKLV